MFHKLALAVKSKTLDFFADDENDDATTVADDDQDVAPAAVTELIPNQRLIILKPDPQPPQNPNPNLILSFAFAAVDSLRPALLLLPRNPEAADKSLVNFLNLLSHLKHSDEVTPLLSRHVAQNQLLLRSLDFFINQLNSEIEQKDSEAATLENFLRSIDAHVVKLSARLELACTPLEENVDALLTVGVFDSVLRDTCRVTHRFARVLGDLMLNKGWDLVSAANCVRPGVNFAKPGHWRYAVLSYVSLGMFQGFDSWDFDTGSNEFEEVEVTIRRNDSLQQFIEFSALDAVEVVRGSPECEFSEFCRRKYGELVSAGMESSLFGNLESGGMELGSFQSTNALYEPFVSMAGSVWMLHKLAWAYDPVVEIFQVAQGAEFSMVFMDNIIRKGSKSRNLVLECKKMMGSKVGFTVIPGFRVGKTVVQCRVYLDEIQ